MKIAFFSAKTYEKEYFSRLNKPFNHQISYFDSSLCSQTAALATDHDAVCAFVNDTIDENCLTILATLKIKVIALRSAGYNHVDLNVCQNKNIKVCYVPDYSPYSVAEHTFALLLTLNRKTHKAYQRVREGDFSLTHLMGSELHGKTFGLIGLGRIGKSVAAIANGFGMKVIAFDPSIDSKFTEQNNIKNTNFNELLKSSDIISLHCPLNKATNHLLDSDAFAAMKDGVMLINTGRGGLIEHKALITALKSKKVGAVALDVYEQEKGLFFYDHSEDIIYDDVLMRLISFPNVLITSHQGFFTDEALTNIANTTLQNLKNFELSKPSFNEISA